MRIEKNVFLLTERYRSVINVIDNLIWKTPMDRFTSFKSKTDIFVSFQYNYPYHIWTNRFERQKMFDIRKAKIITRIIIMIQK